MYSKLINFGPSVAKSPLNNPLVYCMNTTLGNNMLHTNGNRTGPYSQKCQQFMSDRCAQKWDGICEVASRNTNNHYPNTANSSQWQWSKSGDNGACLGTGIGSQFTQGDNLIRNTAMKKYVNKMSSNCALKYEPFDPMVPTSPMISYWDPHPSGGSCVPMYEVDPKTIDNDPVMGKLLSKPLLGMDILLNIYNTARRTGKLRQLMGTKLHNFFKSSVFQSYAQGSAKMAQMKAYGK